MNSKIGLLAGLLVVQLVLIGIAELGGGQQERATPFLSLDADQVTSLVISDQDGHRLELSRSPEGWRVGELPADGDKISGVIEALAGGVAGWPVATSEDSQHRFEVTEEKHQRRIDFLGASGSLGTVYLGTSPGYRRVHARQEGEDPVFSIDFAVHEVPTEENDWLDKQLLRSTDVQRIELPGGHVLAREGEAWILDGAATDPEAARRYVERLERLSVLGRHVPEAEETLGAASTVRVEDAGGGQRLTFRFNEAEDEYVVTSDRYPGEFTMASFLVEQILADPSDLLPEADAADGSAEDPAMEDPAMDASHVDAGAGDAH